MILERSTDVASGGRPPIELAVTRAVILIVVPPFAHAGFPALGPSLLKAQCLRQGLRASVLYSNLELAARVGCEQYNRIALAFDQALVGERIFRAAAFPDELGGRDQTRFCTDFTEVDELPAITEEMAERLFSPGTQAERSLVAACVDQVEPFVDAVVARILDSGARVVGFSSSFQQTLASIAIARRLTGLTTVLGGINASQPGASALTEVTGAFDYVFSGEADTAFPSFCADLLGQGRLPPQPVIDCAPLSDLEQAPVPDYEDYFQQVTELDLQSQVRWRLPLWLPFEASRGCWWGERKQCIFCGLNGNELRHRRKSGAKVMQELARLSSRYGVKRLHATDNILPRSFHRQLLPELAAADAGYELFWETRADLTSDQLDLCVRAGLTRLQPGIESFATGLLQRLGKGTTGVANLVLLRECRSRAIDCEWNLLVGVPGERAADYESIISLAAQIEHLQPPRACIPVRIDRFSPLYREPQDHGLDGMQAFPVYRELFPDGAPVDQLANHFVADRESALLQCHDLRLRLARVLLSWIRAWCGNQEPPVLAAAPLAGGLVMIKDTRSCAIESMHLVSQEVDSCLYQLQQPKRRSWLDPVRAATVDDLLRRRYVVEHEGRLVSLVTRPALAAQLRSPSAK
jgi:ribosomal peptide maturation radical SAM protein 1